MQKRFLLTATISQENLMGNQAELVHSGKRPDKAIDTVREEVCVESPRMDLELVPQQKQKKNICERVRLMSLNRIDAVAENSKSFV